MEQGSYNNQRLFDSQPLESSDPSQSPTPTPSSDMATPTILHQPPQNLSLLQQLQQRHQIHLLEQQKMQNEMKMQQSRGPSSPLLSPRFKRKGLLDNFDLNDNYQAQKRYISEKMANEIGVLSIAQPKSSPPKSKSFLFEDKNKYDTFNPFLTTKLPNGNQSPIFLFDPKSTTTTTSTFSPTSTAMMEDKVTTKQFVPETNKCGALIVSNNSLKSVTVEDDTSSSPPKLKVRGAIAPYRPTNLPTPLYKTPSINPQQPDYSRALVLYKSPAEVILQSISKKQWEEKESMMQVDPMAAGLDSSATSMTF